LAEPEGYIRVFLNVGKPIQNILAAYLRSGVLEHQHFAQKIMDAFLLSDRVGPSVSPLAGLVESLSERELEVLQFMAMGLTNEEIAQQLVVARGTIKAHAASIYRKLEVANRTEAVTRARQLGILP
jgi:LuxR family maltose regulon positive regulatory protein